MDKETKPLKEEFETQIQSRNALLKKWEWLAPAAMVHEHLSALSKTDRKSHLNFVESTYDFHDQLKSIYYAKIFGDEKFNQEDLRKLQAMSER